MGQSGSGIDEKIILSVGVGLIGDFVLIILSIPFCLLPFCPQTVIYGSISCSEW